MTALTDKNYAEQNMVDLFTCLLADQVIQILVNVKGKYERNILTPLGVRREEMDQKAKEIRRKLEQKHKFNYPGEGNVYQDYRTLRNARFSTKMDLPLWVQKKQFNLSSTPEHIYHNCREIVETWWSE